MSTKTTALALIFVAVAGAGCILPGPNGRPFFWVPPLPDVGPGGLPVFLAPPLPPIVEFGPDRHYYHDGCHYYYRDNAWFYSRQAGGPLTALPRDRYPRESRFKNPEPRRVPPPPGPGDRR